MNLPKELEIGCTNLLLFILSNIKTITLVHYIGFPIEFKHFVALSRRVKLKQTISIGEPSVPTPKFNKEIHTLTKIILSN